MTRRYPAYQDSGVEWLGEVPVGWELKRLRFVATFTSGGTPNREKLEFWGGDIPWVSPKDMKAARIDSTEENITELGLAESAAALFDVGTVLIVARSGILKHTIPVAMNVVPVSVNQDIKAVRFDERRILPAYFVYLVAGHNDELLLLWSKQGATVESLEQQYISDSYIPLPSLPEQTAIAAFLDRETAKIDALVAEQRRLIDLLKEKRQAVISHAVTRGLNPAAKLKPSGVDWLGDVPEGWEVKRLRFLSQIETGSSDTQDADDDAEFPFFVRSDTVERIGHFTHDCEAVMTSGDGAGVGKIFHHFDGKFSAHQRVYIFTDFQAITGKFFFHYLKANFFKVALEGGAKSTVDSLRRPLIANFWMTVPPATAQDEIVEFIESADRQFSELASAAEAAITLLQERRAALISAAVTGKIDVRDLVPNQTEAA